METALVHTVCAIGTLSQLDLLKGNRVDMETAFIKQITRPNLPLELTSMMM